MKKYKYLPMLFFMGCLISLCSSAQMDNSFTYQGELLDNGSPANDTYDFQVIMLDGAAQQVGVTSQHNAVQVTNGLFNLNVSFGIAAFDGYEDYYLEISVRKTSVGGAYTTLNPLQQLQSVPLASNLVNGDAVSGEVLTFNGFQWTPAAPASLWNQSGNNLYYDAGKIGIGTNNPVTPLDVRTTSSFEAMRFSGGDRMYITFYENNSGRGYLGSFQAPSGSVLGQDFEIGTYFNSGGNFHITTGANEPRITVDPDGLVGAGTTDPLAKLHVEANAGEDPLLVRLDGSTKLWVKEDGNTNIFGDALFYNDTKQGYTDNGQLKYMVRANCHSTGSSMIQHYNGTTTPGVVSVSNGASSATCTVTFPTDIHNRYWITNAKGSAGYGRGAGCDIGSTNKDLICRGFDTESPATAVQGEITILVY